MKTLGILLIGGSLFILAYFLLEELTGDNDGLVCFLKQHAKKIVWAMWILGIVLVLTGCGGGGGGGSSGGSAEVTTAPTVSPITPAATVVPQTKTKIVFIGASIIWQYDITYFFPSLAANLVNMGSNGETTSMMLARFDRDVLSWNPKTVVILGGGNDVVRLTTWSAENIRLMAEKARASGANVVIALNPPISSTWTSSPPPVSTDVRCFNAQIVAMAKAYGFTVADTYSVLANTNGEPLPGMTRDGMHLTLAGYAEMTSVLKPLL